MYVFLFHDGIGPSNPYPDPPSEDNQAANIGQALTRFQEIARATMRDQPTDDGGAWADLYSAEDWDGISYGDNLVGRITIGPRGGARWQWA